MAEPNETVGRIKFLGLDYINNSLLKHTEDPYALLDGLREDVVNGIIESIQRVLKTESLNYVSEVLAIKVQRFGFLLRINNEVLMTLNQFRKQWNDLIYVLVYLHKNKFAPNTLEKAISIGQNMICISDRDSEFVSIFFMRSTE